MIPLNYPVRRGGDPLSTPPPRRLTKENQVSDATLEDLFNKLRTSYALKSASEDPGSRAMGGTIDIVIAFERWMHSLDGIGGLTSDNVLDAVGSLTTTMLARVIDPICHGKPENFREAVVSEMTTAIYEVLVEEPGNSSRGPANAEYIEGKSN